MTESRFSSPVYARLLLHAAVLFVLYAGHQERDFGYHRDGDNRVVAMNGEELNRANLDLEDLINHSERFEDE